MFYTIHNKLLNKNLTHPAVGLWFTPKLEEAEDMLKACKEYVRSLGMSDEDYVIIEVTS